MNRCRAAYRVLILICGLLSFHVSTSAQVEQAWFARYNGPTNGWDSAVAVALGADGSVHVAGGSEGSAGNLDYVIAKFTPDGNPLWASRYNGTGNGNDVPAAIQVDPNGNIHATGTSRGATSGDDIATLKYDANGNQLWASRYTTFGNKNDTAAALALDSVGNVYVTGTATSNNAEYVTIKYDPDGNELWKTFHTGTNSNTTDIPAALAVDAQGNVYVTGSSSPAYFAGTYTTIKYGTNGSQLWVARYAGSGGLNYPVAIQVDSAGNVYVTGRTEETDRSSRYDYATVKYSSSGTQIWAVRYRGASGSRDDRARALGLDASGNVYVTGTSAGASADDIVTLCYAPDGSQSWLARYNGPANGVETAAGLAVDLAGGVYVNGASRGSAGAAELATIKYAPNGNQLWVMRSAAAASTNSASRPIVVGDANEVYVSGEVPGLTALTDMALFKFLQTSNADYPVIADQPEPISVIRGSNAVFTVGATGLLPLSFFWHFNSQTQVLATTQTLLLNNVQPAQQGDYTVQVSNALGWVESPAARLTVNYITNQPQSQSVVHGANAYFKVEATGTAPFSYRWQFNGVDIPGATNNLLLRTNVQPEDAGYYVAVVSNVAGIMTSDVARLSINTQVRQIWADSRDPGHSLAVDLSANLYVAGSGNWLDASSDYITCKFAPDGTRLWRAIYNGPGNGFDGFSTWWFFKAQLIAVDAAGNAYVSGTSKGTAGVSDNDYATIKYDTNGNPVWVARLDAASPNETAFASCMALDAHGNVYVTGFGSPGYRTVKYDNNGNLLWVTNYTGADLAYDLALDGEANVYITGYQLTASFCDYETVKYDTDGHQLWAAIYSATGWTEGDAAFGLALDSHTNVIVAGVSYMQGVDQDYATVKYDRNGTNLWARRYPDGGLSAEAAYDVEVDALDNIYVTGSPGTIKYSPAGERLWFTSAAGRRVKVDAQGAAYVLNTSSGGITGNDYVLTKLDMQGNRIWEARYGTLNSDSASALLLFGETNVYVTGSAGTVKYVQQATPPLGLKVKAGLTNNLIQFSVTGEAGRFYAVEASTNLVDWVTITNLVNATGTASFVDPAQGTHPVRFYRAYKEF